MSTIYRLTIVKHRIMCKGTLLRQAEMMILLVIVTLLSHPGRGELVQIITPEKVAIVTPQPLENATVSERNSSVAPVEEVDSYLKAYKESRAQIRPPANIKRKDPEVVYEKPNSNEGENPYSTVDHSSQIEDSKYPVITYDQGYAPSRPYLPPPSSQIYGPAAPVHFDEIHPHSHPEPSFPSYGTPFSAPGGGGGSGLPFPFMLPMLSLFPKLPKIDIQMIAKLVLKVVLFKLFVKFLAVICLLLVIPTLDKKKPSGDDDDDDHHDHDDREREINNLTSFIWEGIAKNMTEVVTDEDVEEEFNTEGYEGNDMNEISGNELEEKEEIVEEIADVAEDKTSTTKEETAVRFLEFCVSAVNTVVTSMLGFLRMHRNDYDVLDKFFMDKIFAFPSTITKTKQRESIWIESSSFTVHNENASQTTMASVGNSTAAST